MQNTQPPYNIISTQNVTATRALGVLYTNTSGRTMFVVTNTTIGILVSGGQAILRGYVNGVSYDRDRTGGDTTIGDSRTLKIILIVSPGNTYKVEAATLIDTDVTLVDWVEAY